MWKPKQGEMVSVPQGEREFIAVTSKGSYLCWDENKAYASAFYTNDCSEIKPELVIERRWKWLFDENDRTLMSSSYMPEKFAKANGFQNWYKSEDYIDVQLKEK